MVERIVLSIRHSDHYTDFLFQTAGLTNRRIIPLVDPDPAALRTAAGSNALVIKCFRSNDETIPNDLPVLFNPVLNTLRVYARWYLAGDGSIDAARADMVRDMIRREVESLLLRPMNVRQVYLQYFPLLWYRRQNIFEDTRLFFAESGRSGDKWARRQPPLGVLLKAMEEDLDAFRVLSDGCCSCREHPFLLDYDEMTAPWWKIHTWCPRCGCRREIGTDNDSEWARGDHVLKSVGKRYKAPSGLTPLTLFEVIDTLESSRR